MTRTTTCPIPSDRDLEMTGSKSNAFLRRGSPIPADDVSKPDSFRIRSEKIRLGPDALKIARSHQGNDLAILFNPAFHIVPLGMKTTHREARDYGRENYRKIKEIQKANREKQNESARNVPMRAVYNKNKYEHVPSKVAQRIQTPNAPRTQTASPRIRKSLSLSNINLSINLDTLNSKESSPELKRKPNKQTRPNSARSYRHNSSNENSKNPNSTSSQNTVNAVERKNNSRQQTMQGASSKLSQSARVEKENTVQSMKRPSSATAGKPHNHILHNKQSLKRIQIRRSPSANALDDLRCKKEKAINDHRKGTIPKYLRDRQKEWKEAEEERIANLPDPTIPPGHTLMPEQQKQETINMLRKSHLDLMTEMHALPVSRDTLRVRNKRDELEKKMQEVDTAMKIFSRPRVFVKDE